eukprot:13727457-Alexandrium_andersonii.AAC.1
MRHGRHAAAISSATKRRRAATACPVPRRRAWSSTASSVQRPRHGNYITHGGQNGGARHVWVADLQCSSSGRWE